MPLKSVVCGPSGNRVGWVEAVAWGGSATLKKYRKEAAVLYSRKERAAALAVLYGGVVAGALIGTIAAVVIQAPDVPMLSGICMGTGIGGYFGLRVGERVGQKVDKW